jgi:hypothetical protein
MQPAKYSGKDPVNFFPALNPAKNDPIIRCYLATDPVFSGTDAIIILVSSHLVDIKIVKKVFRFRDLVKDQPFNP